MTVLSAAPDPANALLTSPASNSEIPRNHEIFQT